MLIFIAAYVNILSVMIFVISKYYVLMAVYKAITLWRGCCIRICIRNFTVLWFRRL